VVRILLKRPEKVVVAALAGVRAGVFGGRFLRCGRLKA
jgi:hypothetical protein